MGGVKPRGPDVGAPITDPQVIRVLLWYREAVAQATERAYLQTTPADNGASALEHHR